MNSHTPALAIAVASLLLTACGQQASPPAPTSKAPAAPDPHASIQAAVTPPQAPAAVAAPAPAPAAPLAQSDKLVIQGFAAPVPPAWMRTQPASTMRVAQFAVPPAGGAEAGEVVAFFFPAGQGGTHESNIERWASQFVSADGKPVAPKMSSKKSGGTEVTLVELHGTYARGVGMGPTGDAKPDQALLTAMVETSIGRITLQMYGPSKTVAAQRDGFVKLAQGFRPA